MKRFLNLPVLSFVLALIMVVVLGPYYFLKNKDSVLPPTEEKENVVDLGGGISAIVEDVPREADLPMPDLKRSFPAGTSEDSQARIEKIIDLIEVNPTDVSNWINLGLVRRSIGDFEGAKEAWEYVSEVRPKNPVILGNLGVLYGYNLGDKVKAEDYFKQAIDADKLYEYPYIQLFEFYRDVLGDINKAKGAIEEGLKNIPNSEWLKSILSENVKAI